jgi:hypothetical protein
VAHPWPGGLDRAAVGVSPMVTWCCVVWCGVVWCGVVWCGVVWCGVVWCGSSVVGQSCCVLLCAWCALLVDTTCLAIKLR